MTKWVLTLSCPDRPGIVAAVAGALATLQGNITESQQFGDADSGLFFMRVEVEADVEVVGAVTFLDGAGMAVVPLQRSGAAAVEPLDAELDPSLQ